MTILDIHSRLKGRTVELRNTEQESTVSDPLLQVVSFELGKEVFAIDILQVQEIIRMMEITQVPNAPEFVEGVISLRGKVIPVVDLRKRFHIPAKENNPQERIMVVKIEDKPVGVIVDAVSEVLRFPKDEIEPAPAVFNNIDSQCFAGVAKAKDRLLIILDETKLLSDSEQRRL